jgi:hypothetical protein
MPLRRFYGRGQINQTRALTGRPLGDRDTFDGRPGQRQDRDPDAVAVHVFDPLVELPQPTLDIGEIVGTGEIVSMPVTSTNGV